MSLTIKPILGCNMGCTGCYEGEIFRQNGNKPAPYDLEAIKAKIHGAPAGAGTLHGGEILLMPHADVRYLCEALRADGRAINMQTNGSMVTPELLAILKEFKVNVGVSINGPAELNRDRRAAPHNSKIPEEILLKATDLLTTRIENNIYKMLSEDIEVGLITVLSVTNAGSEEKLDKLIKWGLMMESRGVESHRWNLLHQDFDQPRVELTADEAAYAYKWFCDVTFALPHRFWYPFKTMFGSLNGQGVKDCWFAPCDPYSTAAVYSVFNDGGVGNCLRTAKDGIPYLRAEDGEQHHRQELLAAIPVNQGGCGGCKYWKVCYGGCPGEAVDGDWRNKSRFCKTFIDTYSHLTQIRRAFDSNWEPTLVV